MNDVREVDADLRMENTMLRVASDVMATRIMVLHDIVNEQRGLVNTLWLLVGTLLVVVGVLGSHIAGWL